MQTYVPSTESDILILNWYMEMAQSDDFEQTFSAEFAPCSAFMAAMTRSLVLYEADEKGIWGVVWFDRLMCGGAFGLWIRADKRVHSTTLPFILDALESGLEKFPVLLLVTKQRNVIEQAERIGFQKIGDIPWIFDGETAHVAWGDRKTCGAAFAEMRTLLAPPADGASA